MVDVRGTNDSCLQAIADILRDYADQHADAEIVVYRQNSASVRVRIVDPDFAEISKADRHDMIWNFVKSLPEDQQSEISVLLLLTPDEASRSFANEDFDNPVPSRI